MPSSLGSDRSTTSSRPRRARGYVALGVAAAVAVGGGVFMATGEGEQAPATAALTADAARVSAPTASPTAATASATAQAQARQEVQAARSAMTASRSQARTSAAATAKVQAAKDAKAKAAKAAKAKAAKDASARAAKTKAAKATQARAVRAGAATKRNEAPRDIGRRLVAAKGWSSQQFSCLDKLWTKESNWTVNADNPTSSAYGIPQALPGKKMAAAGSAWRHDAETQITWGLGYINDVYGTPCSAWSHSRANNWY